MTSVASFTDGDRIAIGLEEGLYVIEVTRDGECVALGPSALCRRQGSAVGTRGHYGGFPGWRSSVSASESFTEKVIGQRLRRGIGHK